MTTPKQEQTSTTELIDRKELGIRLGIHAGTVARLDREGVFPSIKVGGSVRYQWENVVSSLEKRPAKNHTNETC